MDLLLKILGRGIKSPLPDDLTLTNSENLNIAQKFRDHNIPWIEQTPILYSSSKPEVRGISTTTTPTPQSPIPTSTPVPNPQTFWENFTNLIRTEASKRGYNPDILIRQKALESDFGRSNFATQRNNFGGVGAYTENPDNAFSYDSPLDYLNAYFDLIKKNYPEAYANRANPEKYVQGLKNGGYATDPKYVWKVLNTPLMPR